MDKIVLTGEQETLLIPLYGKSRENGKQNPILVDQKAKEIVELINYDFEALRIPEKTNIMMCIRARLIDLYVEKFLIGTDRCIAIHLGCGLDSRYDRIKNDSVDWYDLDFAEVTAIRKLFYSDTNHYHMIGYSVTDPQWLDEIPKDADRYIIIAEGLLMYLKEEEIRALVNRLKEKLGKYTLIFDAFSQYTARKVNNHPSLKKTNARVYWGIDNVEEFKKLYSDAHFVETIYFTSDQAIINLDQKVKMMFKFAHLFRMAREAHRILVYHID